MAPYNFQNVSVRSTFHEDPHARASQRARNCSCFNDDAGTAAACGNDGGQAVVLEPLPSGLKARYQLVSPNGHGVRLGCRRAMSRGVTP